MCLDPPRPAKNVIFVSDRAFLKILTEFDPSSKPNNSKPGSCSLEPLKTCSLNKRYYLATFWRLLINTIDHAYLRTLFAFTLYYMFSLDVICKNTSQLEIVD